MGTFDMRAPRAPQPDPTPDARVWGQAYDVPKPDYHERVPALVDALDILLSLYIAEAMVNERAHEADPRRFYVRRPGKRSAK